MQQNKPKLDIINMLLEDCIMAYPVSSFVISIYQQYQQRGWLSKKQLQGLYGKASKINGVLPGRLAALESIIKQMPTRDRSELPENVPMFEKDKVAGNLIEEILSKYPQHKRVLFLKAKYDNNEVISATEVAELNKFKKLLFKIKNTH
ncbi:MAG TPA: hypothetical protein VIQ23_11595 [Hanamia sp.]